MKRGQRECARWFSSLVAVLVVAAGATRAAATPAPATCTPACQPGETCIGGTCMVPARPSAPPPAFPTPPGPGTAPPGPAPAFPPPAMGPPPPAPMYPTYPSYRRAPPTLPPVPQAYDVPPPPTKLRRFMALPYIGTHSYQTDTTRAYFPGLRLGTLIGGRITETLSLNWELTFDISNIDEPAGSPSSSEFAFDFAFSPLVHIPAGPAEIVLGPKLGVFWVSTDVHDNTVSYSSVSHQGTGVVGGITAGTFMAVSGSVSLGVLLSGELRRIAHSCAVTDGEIALCDLARDSAASIIGLTAAAIFR